MSNFEAIIFDYGGVIANKVFTIYDVFKALNIEFPKNQNSELEEILISYEKGIPNEEFKQSLKEKLNLELPENFFETWKKIHNEKTGKDCAVLEIIKKLKSKNYKLAMLSNVNKIYGEENYKNGTYDIFDVLILSYEVGMIKPEPDIYKLTLEKLGLPGDRCIFIDDRIENLEPAKRLGIHTIHFKDAKALEDELKKLNIL